MGLLGMAFLLSFLLSGYSFYNDAQAVPGYQYNCHIRMWIERYCEPATGDCYDIIHNDCVNGYTAGQTPCDCGDIYTPN